MIEVLCRARWLVGELLRRVLMLRPAVHAALDRRVRIDPELERWAERVFGELRQAPLVRPSHDLAESVKQRLPRPPGAPAHSPSDQVDAGQE